MSILAQLLPATVHGIDPADLHRNMSHSDSESDDYLSDPSDDEDSKSVDDLELAEDHRGVAGYQETAVDDSPADTIDYALHDAEAERAQLRQAAKPADAPQEEQKKSTLSASAHPWVPGLKLPGSKGSLPEKAKEDPSDKLGSVSAATTSQASSSTELPGSSGAPSKESNEASREGLEKLASEEKPGSGSLKSAEDELETPRSTSTALSSPAKEASDEAPKSPIDVESMLAKAAAAHPGSAKNGAKDAPESSEKPGRGEITQNSEPENAPKSEGAESLPLESKAEAKAEVPPPAKPPANGADGGAKPSSDSQASPTSTIETESASAIRQREEKPAGDVAGPSTPPPAESKDDSATGPSASDSAKDAEVGGRVPTSETDKQAKKPVGVPSLPERKRPPSAMPSLPARPPRKTAAPASKPEPSESSAEAGRPEQQNAPSEASTSSQAQESEGNTTEQRPPANGQRGQVVVQRVDNEQPSQEPAVESEKVMQLREQLRDLRILLLRVASRLGMSNHAVVEHVKYRLGLASRIRLGKDDTGENLSKVVEQLEEASPDEDLYHATVMVIGSTGSGKSSTINSLLSQEATTVNAFDSGTKKVTVVTGTAFGIKLRFIDTPGLHASANSFQHNARVLNQINNARKKYKPDLIIYCERMDVLRRDLSDIPMMRQITEVLGSEMWFNTILVLTHASTPGPTNPNGQAMPYETISQTRAAMLQRAIQVAVQDQRLSAPAAFAENSPTCARNPDGEPILPSGVAWRKFVLMWIMSMRVLSEADRVMEMAPRDAQATQQQRMLQQLFNTQKPQKLPPLPYLVPNMIRHAGPKQYPEAERDIKREDEIRAMKHPGDRRSANRKRTVYLRSKQAERRIAALPINQEEPEVDEHQAPSPAPALGPSFDSDDTAHLYRSYEPRPGESAWLTRPRLEQTCYDHTDGVESLSTERSFVFRPKTEDLGGIPAAAHAIIQKDKNTQLVQADVEASFYQTWRLIHTGRAQLLTLNGGDILYVSQLESQLKLPYDNRLSVGGMVARLGEEGAPLKGLVALGLKLEEEIDLPEIPKLNCKHGFKAGLGKGRVKLPGGRQEVATGANAEYQLVGGSHEDIQIVASMSQMDYRGNKGRQITLSAAAPLTKETTVAPKLQLQGGGQGTLSCRLTSHDFPHVGLTVLIPLGKALWDKLHAKDTDYR